ncbi:hypothetical protein SNE40_009933 [Patella caerulea]|uniref:Uncharacterized protein n=1 Tax=Patella caerulea TaxID=87958 RepID=A0AAN8PZ92_PATCE
MPKPSVVHDLVAGAVGGSCGIIIGHPFDTVKVQLQTQLKGQQYPSVLSCIKTVKNQGLSKGLFRGLSWPLISYAGVNAVYFGVNGKVISLWNDGEECRPSYLSMYVAGSLAGLAQLVIACPIDVIKVVLQSQIPRKTGPVSSRYYSGPIAAFTDILRKRGITGIYRGFYTQLFRDLPSSGIYFTLYEYLRCNISFVVPSIPSQMVNFLSGGISGVVSWLMILPLDVVKSRVQADTEHKHFKGFFDCVAKSYRDEGMAVFYRGGSMISLRAFPVNGVILMTYSECLKFLNTRWGSHSDSLA